VSEDLRKYLDVEEGLRCLIYGYHDIFPAMAHLYKDYLKDDTKVQDGEKDKAEP